MDRMWLFTVFTDTVNSSAISRALSKDGSEREDGLLALAEQHRPVRADGGRGRRPPGRRRLPGRRRRGRSAVPAVHGPASANGRATPMASAVTSAVSSAARPAGSSPAWNAASASSSRASTFVCGSRVGASGPPSGATMWRGCLVPARGGLGPGLQEEVSPVRGRARPASRRHLRGRAQVAVEQGDPVLEEGQRGEHRRGHRACPRSPGARRASRSTRPGAARGRRQRRRGPRAGCRPIRAATAPRSPVPPPTARRPPPDGRPGGRRRRACPRGPRSRPDGCRPSRVAVATTCSASAAISRRSPPRRPGSPASTGSAPPGSRDRSRAPARAPGSDGPARGRRPWPRPCRTRRPRGSRGGARPWRAGGCRRLLRRLGTTRREALPGGQELGALTEGLEFGARRLRPRAVARSAARRWRPAARAPRDA